MFQDYLETPLKFFLQLQQRLVTKVRVKDWHGIDYDPFPALPHKKLLVNLFSSGSIHKLDQKNDLSNDGHFHRYTSAVRFYLRLLLVSSVRIFVKTSFYVIFDF